MREQTLKARKERNAALIEAMLLTASADGKLSGSEMQTLLRRVIERPEFEGTRPEELNALVEGSAAKLAGAKNLDEILVSLRARLPDHPSRLLAFGLASAIAFADRRATRAELGLLKTFQAALGISEDEVARVIDVVEQEGSLAEALGDPIERLYAEVMVLLTVADGQVKEAEARVMVETLAADPAFQEVGSDKAQGYIAAAVSALAREGLSQRLTALAHGLSTHGQRLKAFRLATRVAQASGEASPSGEKLLDLLQATFGLADDEVSKIRREA